MAFASAVALASAVAFGIHESVLHRVAGLLVLAQAAAMAHERERNGV